MSVRVRNPHSQYIERLGKEATVEVKERSTGLYFLREKRKFDGLIGITRVRQDFWVIFPKKPPKVKSKTQKYTLFE